MTSEQVVAGKKRRTAAEIEQIVAEFESSVLNRTQFCRQQGLTLGVLNRSLKRMQAGCSNGASRDGLVAVELAGKKLGAVHVVSGLTVELARMRRIAVSADFDAVTLQRLGTGVGDDVGCLASGQRRGSIWRWERRTNLRLRLRGLQPWCECEISRPFQRRKLAPKCVPLSMLLDRKSERTSEINSLNITNDEN